MIAPRGGTYIAFSSIALRWGYSVLQLATLVQITTLKRSLYPALETTVMPVRALVRALACATSHPVFTCAWVGEGPAAGRDFQRRRGGREHDATRVQSPPDPRLPLTRTWTSLLWRCGEGSRPLTCICHHHPPTLNAVTTGSVQREPVARVRCHVQGVRWLRLRLPAGLRGACSLMLCLGWTCA